MLTNARDISKSTAIRFVILLGLVSLFADITYEGARSISGPFLAVLGASGAAVGIVAGFGELLGYGLRLASGLISDRTRRYWALTMIGYAINLLAVPLMALAGRWEIAALLMMAERIGKAIRTPARDAMLSHATHATGRGWGFGLHEAMDQIGAVAGPLLVSAALFVRGEYQAAFAFLAIPAVLAIGTLALARFLYPRPRDLEVASARLEPRGLPKVYWIYLAGAALVAAGFADFPLIAFHFEKNAIAPSSNIPILYAIAMGVDAIAALIFGRLFDQIGLGILAGVTAMSALFAPLVFLGDLPSAVVGMVLWGVGMGAQESILRAAVAEMSSADRRGTAYGIFNTGYGAAWFLGSALMGVLYDAVLPALIAFSVIVQLASAIIFSRVGRTTKRS
ncbi:MAG: MFS transporter [Anaerolineae bacterium]|nr:MFS transporter [Anaerolineae bacterium]